jgi:hypothetical protein
LSRRPIFTKDVEGKKMKPYFNLTSSIKTHHTRAINIFKSKWFKWTTIFA